jgi:hypothetical protein
MAWDSAKMSSWKGSPEMLRAHKTGRGECGFFVNLAKNDAQNPKKIFG